MGTTDWGSKAQSEVEVEQRRRGWGELVLLQRLPRYDEWPADTTVQLNANISIVYTLTPCVIHHLFLPWLCYSFRSSK